MEWFSLSPGRMHAEGIRGESTKRPRTLLGESLQAVVATMFSLVLSRFVGIVAIIAIVATIAIIYVIYIYIYI